MKTQTPLLLLVLALASNRNSLAQSDPIPVTSVPVAMIEGGRTAIEIMATPPPGMRIAKVVIYLEPIGSLLPRSIFEAMKPVTNSVPAPRLLELPKPTPPMERKMFRNLSLGEPNKLFRDERPAFLRITFKLP
ncbi:MAG: hypothetical protein Q7R93_02210 [bacterium]|nr:hypothetical protein [bacterium]